MIHVIAARSNRLAAFIPGQRRQATDGINGACSGAVGMPRPGMPVSGTAQGNDIRFDGRQAVVIQAVAAHGSRSEVIRYHVNIGRQFEKNFLAHGLRHLDAQALFVAAPIGECTALIPPRFTRHAIGKWTGTAIIHMIRTFDPNHLSPEIR